MKPCEQKLFKTFYFQIPNFVELLHVYGSLPKYFQILIKCFGTPNKIPKSYWCSKKLKEIEIGLSCEKGKFSQGVIWKNAISFL